jgi:hypothetical protein
MTTNVVRAAYIHMAWAKTGWFSEYGGNFDQSKLGTKNYSKQCFFYLPCHHDGQIFYYRPLNAFDAGLLSMPLSLQSNSSKSQ